MGLLIVYICWGIVAATWLVGALYNARKAPKTLGRSRFQPWTGWVLAAVALWSANRFVPASVWARLTFHNPILSSIGVALLVASTAFTVWARWTLGTMWSSVPTVREHHELRTHGPYRLTRHPIYTGLLGMLLGTALINGFGMVLLALLGILGVFVVNIWREERLMQATFGEQYERYCREVPRLVPFTRL
jgi:protein-S-isoprenylcysteine O-methyltransferase Ste14